MNSFPTDVISLFFELLDTRDLIMASRTCKQWRRTFKRNIEKYQIVIDESWRHNLDYFDNPVYRNKKGIQDHHLKYLKGVKHISFHNCYSLTDKGLKHLYNPKSPVHTIYFNYCLDITDKGLRYLQGVRDITIWDCPRITGVGFRYLAGVKTFKFIPQSYDRTLFSELKYLKGVDTAKLRDNGYYKITDDDLATMCSDEPVIERVTVMTKLMDLVRPKRPINPEPYSKLHTLDISHCSKITGSFFKHLVGIHTLIISYCGSITDEALQHLSGVKVINLTACSGITDKGIQYMVEVEEINMSHCYQITDKALLNLRGVRIINLAGCVLITDAGLSYLDESEIVDLTHCSEITDAGLGLLTKVKTLVLTGCYKITNSGMKHLDKVHTLDIVGCNVDYDGLVCLTSIRSLALSDYSFRRPLTDKSMALLSKLDSVHLYGCRKVTNKGISYLKDVQQLHLILCDTITDDALLELTDVETIQIQHCPNITNVGRAYIAHTHDITSERFAPSNFTAVKKKDFLFIN